MRPIEGKEATCRAPDTVLVTGATGVVGRRAVPLLIAAGHRVVAVGRTPEKRAWLEAQGARAVALDLYDGAGQRRTMAGEGVEAVVNLATHIPGSAFRMMLPWSWRENDRVRREGSATLVAAARDAGVRRVVQESFAPIYEDAGDAWIHEGAPVRPVGYNRSVLDAERAAARFTEEGGTGVVLRFAAFYGPDAMLRTMVDAVRRGWYPLPGSPTAWWSSVSWEDAATAVVAALEVPAGTYNVCDDEPLTRQAFAATLAEAAGVRPPRPMPRWMAALGGGAMELLSRSERMSNAAFREASEWVPGLRSAAVGIPAAVAALGSERG